MVPWVASSESCAPALMLIAMPQCREPRRLALADPRPSTAASLSPGSPAASTPAVAVSDPGTKASTAGILVAFGAAALLAVVAGGVALVQR